METELTKTIKLLCHTYAPKMSAGKVGRTIRYADEVWVPNKGIVDSIRFEDYIISRYEECELENWEHYASSEKRALNLYAERYGSKAGHCKIDGMCYPNKNCRGCFHLKRGLPNIGMMITAYEIKITKNGKLIWGNDILMCHGNKKDLCKVCFGEFKVFDIENMVAVDIVQGWYYRPLETDGLSKCEPFCYEMPLTNYYLERMGAEVIGSAIDNPELLEVGECYL